jgi:hypothetical protein
MTLTQTWLSAGNRFDDLDLWDRLCHYLELQPGKSSYVRTIPSQLAPLLYDSAGAKAQRNIWERYEVCPVFFLKERGWCLHTDWAQRLDLIRSQNTPELINHIRLILTKRKSKFIQRRTTGVRDLFVCELCRQRAETSMHIIHASTCLITELSQRIRDLEQSINAQKQ